METPPRTHPHTTSIGGRDDVAVLGSDDLLEDAPELAAVLQLARGIDRSVASMVEGLMTLLRSDEAERATGVPLEQWLAIIGRRTGADRRMLFTTCEVLDRLPTLRMAFLHNGTVSWAQTRVVVLKVCRVPHHLDDRIDAALGPVIRGVADADPDALGRAVDWALGSIDGATPAARGLTPSPEQFFAMQPRLDGSGGRVWGEFGALGFATLDAALNVDAAPPAGRTRDAFGSSPDPEASQRLAVRAGVTRAQRLLDLVEQRTTASGESDRTDCGPPGRSGRRPQLLVRIGLNTLLDRDQIPAQLLTTLTGGRLWADAATIRELVALRGADLRTVVLDDTGAVVGVGRRTRVAPDWLADATLAVHDTCSAPGCRVAARVCDLDHAVPWASRSASASRAGTDVRNLAPLCAADNHRKESAGWTAGQDRDGCRTWHHVRSGLSTRTVPGTWGPPGAVAPATPTGPSASADREMPERRPPSRGDPDAHPAGPTAAATGPPDLPF
jgi:hypothetical protein